MALLGSLVLDCESWALDRDVCAGLSWLEERAAVLFSGGSCFGVGYFWRCLARWESGVCRCNIFVVENWGDSYRRLS